MDFSPWGLFGGFVFSVIGLYVFRYGKKEAKYDVMLIGIALMVYSYFTPTAILTWVTGGILMGAAYDFR